MPRPPAGTLQQRARGSAGGERRAEASRGEARRGAGLGRAPSAPLPPSARPCPAQPGRAAPGDRQGAADRPGAARGRVSDTAGAGQAGQEPRVAAPQPASMVAAFAWPRVRGSAAALALLRPSETWKKGVRDTPRTPQATLPQR